METSLEKAPDGRNRDSSQKSPRTDAAPEALPGAARCRPICQGNVMFVCANMAAMALSLNRPWRHRPCPPEVWAGSCARSFRGHRQTLGRLQSPGVVYRNKMAVRPKRSDDMKNGACTFRRRYLKVSTISCFAAFLSFGEAAATPADTMVDRLLDICEASTVQEAMVNGDKLRLAASVQCRR